MLDTYLDYASAIKDVDASARIVGPSLSGWTSLFYSPLDRGSDNFRGHLERQAHGDTPFLPWWLGRVSDHDRTFGVRTLDVVDVHFYPQADGVYAGGTDAATNALRLRSTRALWDPTYTDESWIRQSVSLIPRLRSWIEAEYPDTRIGIGEWNWGADTTLNGALAIADVLGIFGREDIEFATYWTAPAPQSPGALAFQLFTNCDGLGHGFGDLALAVDSNVSVGDAAVYASLDSGASEVVVVAINKRAADSLKMTLELTQPVAATARLYTLGPDQPEAIRAEPEISTAGGELVLSLPASSISLVRMPLARASAGLG
jgi:hypothetical protein